MSWSLPIPFQSRDQTVIEALANRVERALPVEERPVATQLLLSAEQKTIGELCDYVESLDGAGRRRLLNKARRAVGLDSIEDVEAHMKFENANSAGARAMRVSGAREEVFDFATMQVRPAGRYAEELLEKQEREIALLRERDRGRREEAERLAKLEREWQDAHPPVFFEGPRPK